MKDPSGAVVTGATVEVSGPALLGTKKATTDAGGFYRITNLPPGVYTVAVTASGFAPTKRSNLQVVPGRTESIDIAMAVGSAEQVVEVSADATLVQPTESKSQVNIANEVISSIPKGRSYQSLIAFAPGASAEPLQGTGAGNPGFQIDGASNGENAYLVEGMDTGNIQTGRSGLNVPFEFVQEVQIKSSGFEAEHGGALGGVVNVVQKRGSNNWHGQVVTHWRSDRLDANDTPTLREAISGTLPARSRRPSEYYQTKEDKWNVLEPGYELGGALVKDRLWLFSSYIPRWETNTRRVNFASGPQSFRYTDTQHNALNRLDLRITDAIRVFGAWQYAYRRVTGNQRPGADAVNDAALSRVTSGTFSTANPSGVTSPSQYLQDSGFVAPNSVFTTGADITIGSNAVATTRFGYWFTNFGDRGKPSGINYTYSFGTPGTFDLAGNPIPPQVPAAFNQPTGFVSLGSSTAANLNTFFDAYKRTSFQQDLSYFRRTSFGTHNFKGGYGFNRLSNDVFSKYNDARVIVVWGLGYGSTILAPQQVNCDNIDTQNMATYGNVGDGCQGRYGYFIVRDFQTTGKTQSYNHNLYIQDAWNVGGGLTLNMGIRFDRETVPSYNNAPSINFGFGDKIAPRLGAAYDVLRNGKWKIYGSWGWFYDIMKFELPRGSFGGDYWHDCAFALDTPNLANIIPVRGSSGLNCPAVGHPTSYGANARFIEEVDWRVNANAPGPLAGFPFGITKDIKPMRQTEFVVGSDYALGRNLGLEVRYARKRLDRTIEDIGFASPAGEFYYIGNPGENQEVKDYWKNVECPTCQALPKAMRNYDGVEFRLIKQASKNWYGTVSYTYSRLYGNYSGLTSTDEAGRASPNVNRFFDLPHMNFNGNGTVQFGPLPTDRPHKFKGFGYYNLRWLGMETMIGASQLWYSGTPLSTVIGLNGSQSAIQFVEGRGNFQDVTISPTGVLSRGTLHKGLRTETFEQTDLLFTHEIKVSKSNENLRLGFEFNVINLFNQNNQLSTFQNVMINAGSQYLANVSHMEATTTGYDWVAKFNSSSSSRRFSPQYGMTNLFQAPRNLRMALRFRF